MSEQVQRQTGPKSLKDAFAPKDTVADLAERRNVLQAKLEEKAKMSDILTEPEKQVMRAAVELLEGLDGFENQAGMVGLLEKALGVEPKVLRGAQGVTRGQ